MYHALLKFRPLPILWVAIVSVFYTITGKFSDNNKVFGSRRGVVFQKV